MLKLMYITNRPDIASLADRCGVDRIFIDLETIGKADRQGGMDTVQSHHTIADIAPVKRAVEKAKILVRVNKIHSGSEAEIDAAIEAGADLLMLPYFKSVEEVNSFLQLVDQRVPTILLVETREAVELIDDIMNQDGIDEMYIGLNDLHLSYGQHFMFELLADGTVDRLADKFRARGVPFGFGGIARLGGGMLPAEKVIAEHYRLGSTAAILSRTFCNYERIADPHQVEAIFEEGLQEIRNYESLLSGVSDEFFTANHTDVVRAVDTIVTSIKAK